MCFDFLYFSSLSNVATISEGANSMYKHVLTINSYAMNYRPGGGDGDIQRVKAELIRFFLFHHSTPQNTPYVIPQGVTLKHDLF